MQNGTSALWGSVGGVSREGQNAREYDKKRIFTGPILIETCKGTHPVPMLGISSQYYDTK